MLDRITRDPFGFIVILVLLLIFWLLLSGSLDWQHGLAGFIIAFGLTYIWADTIFVKKNATSFSFRQAIGLIYYLICLGIDIVRANFTVAYIVLHPKLPISPGFLSYQLKLDGELSKTLFLNSITLTPGTITVDCIGDKVTIHCFTEENAKEVQDWHLYYKMKKLESGGKDNEY